MKNLVDAADIKTHTTAQLGVDANRLELSVPEAQQRHLRPLLGRALFNELLAYAQLAAPDAEDKRAALLSEVKPMLCQWALIEAWPNLLLHITNAGLVLKTGNAQGTTTADAKLVAQVYTAQRETAVWRGQELSTWLESNKADYPAYESIRRPDKPATGRQPLGGLNVD
jgi:hypothetical protein